MTGSPEPPPPRLLARPWVRSGLYALTGYAGFLLMLVYIENRLVYFPTTARQHWQPKPIPNIKDVELICADGTRVHAWWLPADNSDEALLYCHGNAGNLSHRGMAIVKMQQLLDVSVLIIDYPGYGQSDGRPSEEGCYQSAHAAHAWLIEEKKFAPNKILLYGASLGGGVATELASRTDHRALILVKTFTSLPDVASDLYWWLPVPKRLLMRNRFDNLTRLASCHRPIFIAHGTADRLIPYTHGERLFEAAHEPKHFFSINGAGHNDGLPEEFFRSLKQFLDENR